MEKQSGIVPYKAGRQAISPTDRRSSPPDNRGVQPNPSQTMESAKSVKLPFMVTMIHTDLVYQEENYSRQHLKILCRGPNVWIDVMATLSTGVEDN